MSLKTKLVLLFAVLTLCGFAIWGAFRLDAPIRQRILEKQGTGWKKTEEFKFYATVRKVGDWPPVMLAAGAGLLLARRLRNRRWTHILAAAMIASSLAGIVANTSRLTSGRTRPRESPKIEQGFYGMWHNGQLLFGKSAFQSFPSAHTATSFGFAAAILIASPAWGVLALLGACLVAWSSIAIGAHHPSDVVVSIIIAILVAWLVWKWILGRGGPLLERLLRFKTSYSE